MGKRRYRSIAERIRANIVERAPPPWAALDPSAGPCWIWNSTPNAGGYGRITIRREVYDKNGKLRGRLPRGVLVHRLALEVFRGIPRATVEQALHFCSVKLCCNPAHLDPGTAQENCRMYLDVERPLQIACGGGLRA